MELKDIDLNLLVVFNQPLAERKVSKVAENLGLGQPAVSNALARLRKLFDDELFTRTASGMQPTPFAEQLTESVGYALGMIHGAVNARNTFDPRTSKRSFTVGMTDIGEIYFLPQLMQRIEEVAPSVTISTVRNTATNLKDAMESGQVDLAVGLLPQLRRAFFSAACSSRTTSACFARAIGWTRKRSACRTSSVRTMWPSCLQVRAMGRWTRYWTTTRRSGR